MIIKTKKWNAPLKVDIKKKTRSNIWKNSISKGGAFLKAQKGQKFNNYLYEEKIKIIDEYYNVGGSTYSLAKKYNISRSTIRNWIELYKKNKTISKEETRGKTKFVRPITLEDYKERYEILKKYQAFLKAQRERK